MTSIFLGDKKKGLVDDISKAVTTHFPELVDYKDAILDETVKIIARYKHQQIEDDLAYYCGPENY